MKNLFMIISMLFGGTIAAQAAIPATPTINHATCGIFDPSSVGYPDQYVCEVNVTSGAVARNAVGVDATTTWSVDSIERLETLMESFTGYTVDVRGFVNRSVFEAELANPTYDHRTSEHGLRERIAELQALLVELERQYDEAEAELVELQNQLAQ